MLLFAYLIEADPFIKLQLIIFAFEWYKQLEKSYSYKYNWSKNPQILVCIID